MAEIKDSRASVIPTSSTSSSSSSSSKSKVTFEEVITELGPFGKFQFIQLSLCSLVYLFGGFLGLGFVFIGYTPHHVCNNVNQTEILLKYGLQNDSTAMLSYGSCHVTVSTNASGQKTDIDSFNCPNGRNFTGGRHLTLVSQWDLVCESMGQAEVGQTLFVVGQIVGGFFTSSIADRIGRKSIMVICSIICTIIELSIAFAPNIYTVWGLLFVDGISCIGLNSTFSVLGLEYLRPRHRENFGVGLCLFWVFSVLFVGLFGFIFENIGWRYFQAAGASTGLILFLYPFFLCESPRWLAAKNRTEEALAILKKACVQNGKDFIPVQTKFKEYIEYNMNAENHVTPLINERGESNNRVDFLKSDKDTFSVLYLFRHKYTFTLLAISGYIWFTHNVAYYGIYMTSSSLSGNRFLNFCILGLVEIPSNLLILYLFKRMGRLVIVKIFLLASAISLAASSLCVHLSEKSSTFSVLSTLLFIVGKFAIGSSFNAVFIYTPEIFPTVLRSSGFGACKSMSRVGSVIAPYFRPLYDHVNWAPGIIFSAMCITALMATPFLPETKDKILPTTVEELYRGRNKKEEA